MKKISYISSITFLYVSLFVGCIKSDDKPSSTSNLDFSNVEIQDFIWEGMNTYYLWKDNVPNLANTANDNDQYYLDLLNSKSGPEEFFESLIYNRSTVDEWSWIVDNYVALENSFQGISTSNGVEYRLSYETGSDTKLLGYVRYIQPNSNASSKNIKRGDVFNAVNGVGLTINNYESLLSANSYTLNMADLNNGNPISNGKTVSLIQSEYQENPVYIAKTVTVEGERIGYLMYNSFTSTYDQQLNTAFAQLKSEGATELVLDLRYNSGGSVQTAVYLASMITGQFNGQLFAKEKWNAEVQSWFDANNPDWIVNNFVNKITNDDNSEIAINSLNLTKLYVLTTSSSASASELIINGLKPYINVVTIGTKTSGKYTGSITLYDSDTFGRSGANLNKNHTWAIQPIVLETVNKLGENDKDGFDPTTEVIEYVSQMTELGDVTEPFFAEAIKQITGISGKSTISNRKPVVFVKDFEKYTGVSKYETGLRIEKELPKGFLNRN